MSDLPTQDLLVEEGGEGDCLQSAIAATLRLPKRAVPRFHDGDVFAKDPDNADPVRRPWWYDGLTTWLGWIGYEVEVINDPAEKDLDWGNLPDFVMAGGDSPRNENGYGHAVVWGRNGLIHDPHPSGDGLRGEPTELFIFRSID